MERQEIQRLFVQHYAKMLRVARTILYDEQESQDVVSDIFASPMSQAAAPYIGPHCCK